MEKDGHRFCTHVHHQAAAKARSPEEASNGGAPVPKPGSAPGLPGLSCRLLLRVSEGPRGQAGLVHGAAAQRRPPVPQLLRAHRRTFGCPPRAPVPGDLRPSAQQEASGPARLRDPQPSRMAGGAAWWPRPHVASLPPTLGLCLQGFPTPPALRSLSLSVPSGLLVQFQRELCDDEPDPRPSDAAAPGGRGLSVKQSFPLCGADAPAPLPDLFLSEEAFRTVSSAGEVIRHLRDGATQVGARAGGGGGGGNAAGVATDRPARSADPVPRRNRQFQLVLRSGSRGRETRRRTGSEGGW